MRSVVLDIRREQDTGKVNGSMSYPVAESSFTSDTRGADGVSVGSSPGRRTPTDHVVVFLEVSNMSVPFNVPKRQVTSSQVDRDLSLVATSRQSWSEAAIVRQIVRFIKQAKKVR